MNIPIQSVIFSGLRGVGKTVLINKNKQPLSRDTEFHDAFFPAPSVLPTSACFRLAPISNNEKCQQAKAPGIFTHFIYISFPVEHKNYNRRTIHSHRSISLSRIFSF